MIVAKFTPALHSICQSVRTAVGFCCFSMSVSGVGEGGSHLQAYAGADCFTQ